MHIMITEWKFRVRQFWEGHFVERAHIIVSLGKTWFRLFWGVHIG